jgi:hypothetical protein
VLPTVPCAARTQAGTPHYLLGVPELSKLQSAGAFPKQPQGVLRSQTFQLWGGVLIWFLRYFPRTTFNSLAACSRIIPAITHTVTAVLIPATAEIPMAQWNRYRGAHDAIRSSYSGISTRRGP